MIFDIIRHSAGNRFAAPASGPIFKIKEGGLEQGTLP